MVEMAVLRPRDEDFEYEKPMNSDNLVRLFQQLQCDKDKKTRMVSECAMVKLRLLF